MLLYLNTFQESKQIETCMRQNDCWQNIFHIGDNFLKKKNFPTWKKLSSSTLNALWLIAFYFNTKVNSSAIFTTPNRICQTPYLWAPGIKPYWLWKGGFQCNQLNVNHWKKGLKTQPCHWASVPASINDILTYSIYFLSPIFTFNASFTITEVCFTFPPGLFCVLPVIVTWGLFKCQW